MNTPGSQRKLYIETLQPDSDEALSLHLARHLPRRLAVGSVIILHDRPVVFLAVIRKRWMQMIREIERDRSRTLDATKRAYLGKELKQMLRFIFSSRIGSPGNALVTTWPEVAASNLNCFTLYIASPLPEQTQAQAMSLVATGGLVVLYERKGSKKDLPQ